MQFQLIFAAALVLTVLSGGEESCRHRVASYENIPMNDTS